METIQASDKVSPEAEKVGKILIQQIVSPHQELLDRLGLACSGDDDGFIKWKSDSLDHPRNWSFTKKFWNTSLIFMFDLFTTAISTAGPAAAESAKFEYNLTSTQSLIVFGSMYQFGQAFGGVIFPPYSETFGRKLTYIGSAAMYCFACLVVGLTPSVAGAIVGRFASGVMSAVPSVIVSGSVEDMFNLRERTWLIYLWACATTLGLLLGPVYGSYIAAYLGWRSIFHIAAAVIGTFTILLVFIHESRPSRLLSRQLKILHKTISGDIRYQIRNPDYAPDLRTFTKTALTRPVKLFFTEPIVFAISVISAVAWALVYLFTEAIPVIYGEFNLSRKESSLMFLAISLGLRIGILPRLHDHYTLNKRKTLNKPIEPEHKLLGFCFAAPSLAFGLWWLVLTTPPASTLPWYATLPGLVPIGFAINEFACTLSGYLADTYTIYTSSALAALSFLRAVLAGLFPLIGAPMYTVLGTNWAGVVLAGLATGFCISPMLFLRFGRGIRQRSKFAKYSLKMSEGMSIDIGGVGEQ